MDKGVVIHRLSLNMEDQRIQATITLSQHDTATHRLVVDLRHGSEAVEFEEGTHACLAVQNPSAGVDVLDAVTVYGGNGVYPNCIVYDVSTAVTGTVGMHEACFKIQKVINGALAATSSPRIAFVVKKNISSSSDFPKSDSYSAVVKAQAAAEDALAGAERAQAAAEKAQSDAENVCDEAAENVRRAAAEELRAAAEELRAASEKAQAAAEDAQSAAEKARSDAESARDEALERLEKAQDATLVSVERTRDYGLLFTLSDGSTFKTESIRGVDGHTPQFRVNDEGVLQIKRTDESDWETVGIRQVSLSENLSVGNSEAVTKGSVAMGENTVAGARGFYIKSLTPSTVTLEASNHITGMTAAPDYAVGDLFSVINGTHYAFCGKITAINGNVISYTPTTSHGTVSSREQPWWEYDKTSGKADFENHIFWVPEKPLVGYDLVGENGVPVFGAAFAVGDTCCAAADDAFVAGEENEAGGNHAVIFGVKNKGGYGNFVTGRENLSTGLHSSLLGRNLKNHGDYNLVANQSNTLQKGSHNALLGQKNTLDGSYNAVCGSNNTLTGEHCVVGGKAQWVSGSYIGAFGSHGSIKHNYVLSAGYKLQSAANAQALFGQWNKADTGAYLIVGNGNSSTRSNALTVGKSGTREKVDTDAVTVAYLNAALEAERADMNAALEAERADMNAALEAERADMNAALEAERADMNAALEAERAKVRLFATHDPDEHPADLFGGDWTRIEGQFLLGADANYAAGSEGGSADAVVVSHRHNFVGANGEWDGYDNASLFRHNASSVDYSVPAINYGSYGSASGYVYIKEAGENGAGKNMPPYYAMYLWRRMTEEEIRKHKEEGEKYY